MTKFVAIIIGSGRAGNLLPFDPGFDGRIPDPTINTQTSNTLPIELTKGLSVSGEGRHRIGVPT